MAYRRSYAPRRYYSRRPFRRGYRPYRRSYGGMRPYTGSRFRTRSYRVGGRRY